MGLWKSHRKRETPKLQDSRLLGIESKTESSSPHGTNIASFQHYWIHNAEKSKRTVMIEAEFRKAQYIALARQHLLFK